MLDMKRLSANQQAIVWILVGALLMAIVLLWSMPLYRKMAGSKDAFTAIEGEVPMGDHLKSLNNYLCSRDCCSTQYPVGFAHEKDERVDPSIHSTSNFMCSVFEANKGKNAGCMCATKEIKDYHSNRGNNF